MRRPRKPPASRGPWSPYLVEPRASPPVAEGADHAAAILAHAAIRFVIGSGRIGPIAQREMGRALGLGHLAHDESTPGRHVFRSRGLHVPRPSRMPSCTLVLGFAEGLASSLADEPALGAEVSCRATGAGSACSS